MAQAGADGLKFAQMLAEDRRLRILILLEQAPGNTAPADTLLCALRASGHRPSKDVHQNDMMWLAEMMLITVSADWAVEATQRGLDVATGAARAFGVAIRGPEN